MEQFKKYKLTTTSTRAVQIHNISGSSYIDTVTIHRTPIFFKSIDEAIEYIESQSQIDSTEYDTMSKFDIEEIDL